MHLMNKTARKYGIMAGRRRNSCNLAAHIKKCKLHGLKAAKMAANYP